MFSMLYILDQISLGRTTTYYKFNTIWSFIPATTKFELGKSTSLKGISGSAKYIL